MRERFVTLQRHRQADPENFTLVCDVVDACLQLGETGQAGELFKAELTRRPEEPALLFRVCSLALALRDYAESLLLERKGKAEEAKAVVEEVLRRESPTAGVSYLQLAAAHRARLGQR